MHIGILQCGHTAEPLTTRHGDFDALFRNLFIGQSFEFESFDIENMQFPSSPEACEGWLLTGSKHGAYEDHAFIPPLETFIRAAFVVNRPMVGICFGHQIIAKAMGGKVEKFKQGWSLGRQIYQTTQLGEIALNAWHQDQVIQAPAGAETIMRSDFCEHAGLLYPGKALTLQPHPEFDDGFLTDMVASKRGTLDYPDAQMDEALSSLSAPIDRMKVATMLASFLHDTV